MDVDDDAIDQWWRDRELPDELRQRKQVEIDVLQFRCRCGEVLNADATSCPRCRQCYNCG